MKKCIQNTAVQRLITEHLKQCLIDNKGLKHINRKMTWGFLLAIHTERSINSQWYRSIFFPPLVIRTKIFKQPWDAVCIFVTMNQTSINMHEILVGDGEQGSLPGFEELQSTRLSERRAEDAGWPNDNTCLTTKGKCHSCRQENVGPYPHPGPCIKA